MALEAKLGCLVPLRTYVRGSFGSRFGPIEVVED